MLVRLPVDVTSAHAPTAHVCHPPLGGRPQQYIQRRVSHLIYRHRKQPRLILLVIRRLDPPTGSKYLQLISAFVYLIIQAKIDQIPSGFLIVRSGVSVVERLACFRGVQRAAPRLDRLVRLAGYFTLHQLLSK